MKQNYYLGMSPQGFHDLAYTEWGTWSDQFPTIICVHGLTRNGRDFDELAFYLSNKGRYVLCPDVVGRGESSWFTNPTHYNFNQYVSDMNTLIARAHTHHVDWIGTSMGGLIGMMMAALPNTPIRRLVINDIGPQVPIAGLKRLAQYAGKEPVFKTFDEAKAYCKIHYADFGVLSEEQWEQFTEHSIKLRAPNLYTFKMDPGIRHAKSPSQWLNDFVHHPIKALEGVLYDVDLWAIWKQVRCPVLVIHGTHSDLLTPEIITKMQRTHPQVEVYEVENAGHAPALLEQQNHEKIYNWLIKN
jgi:pimeloyl-ACP methyl ester carboxylesterase